MHWFCFSSNQPKTMHSLHFFAMHCPGQGQVILNSKSTVVVTDKTQKYFVSPEGSTTLNKCSKTSLN